MFAALLVLGASRAFAAQSQTITFGWLADQYVGAASPLWATASSGLPVAFATLTPSVCTVSSNSVTAITSGTCTVRASQSGDANFLAAPPEDRTLHAMTLVQKGPLFALPVNYATEVYPDGIASADFNGDGKADLAVVNWSSSTVSILLGRGDGTFLPPTQYYTGVGPMFIAVADFNNDGKLDLAIANLMSRDVSILLGKGDGTFAPATSIQLGGSLFGIAAGDLNGDGKVDLAVTSGTANGLTGQSVFLLYGNGNGTFQTAGTLPTGMNPQAVVIRDVNGDGKPDLIVANTDSNTVSVILALGNGTFASPVNYGVAWSPQGLAVGDLNGDAKPDIAVGNAWSNSVSVLVNRGDGTFPSAVNYPVGTAPGGLVIGDFTGDGKPDLVVLDQLEDNIVVLPGNGNGTFQTAVPYGVPTHPLGITSGDFNADGRQDIAIAAAGANAISVLLRPSSGVAPASLVVTAGANQSAPINSSYATPFAVVVRDGANQPLSGVAVTFVAPATGASGAFNGSRSVLVTSSATGLATAPMFVANGTIGSFTVVASTGALTANFALNNTAGAGVAPSFTTAPPPNGTYGVPYTFAMAATGTPAPTFVITTGSLPPGLTLGSSSGVISGTPAAAGVFTGVIAARNGMAPDASQPFSIAIALVSQTISFGGLPLRSYGSPPFGIAATASSGLPVAFTSLTPSFCSVTGGTVTMLAAGSCTIRASQAGTAQYAPAANVDQTFSVMPGTQTITFPSIAALRLNIGAVRLFASTSSGLPVTFTTSTASVCSVSGDELTLTSIGTCVVRASQNGSANFATAAPVDQAITVSPAGQAITFWPVTDRGLPGPPVVLSASATSGLPITFTSLSPSVCTVFGSSAVLVAASTCVLRATQAGNAFFAAASADQKFLVVNGVVVAPAPAVPKGPFVEYATLLGGLGHDRAFDVVVGPDGSAYVGGAVGSTNFPGLSSGIASNAGLDLLYVGKISPNRGYVDFVTAVGGRAADITGTGSLAYVASLQTGATLYSGGGQVEAMTKDSAGNIYVVAYSSGADFPLHGGTYGRAGSKFIYRVTSTGSVQAISPALDPAVATVRAMATDAAGNIYLTGVARQGLATTAGAAIATIPASNGSFPTATAPYLLKLTATGLTTAFATYLSVPGSRAGSLSAPGQSVVDAATTAYALVVDAAGNSYLAGQATAGDFPVTAGSPDTGDWVNRDAFVAKVNATGSRLLFVARLGGADAERATGIALTPAGDIVIGGKTATQPFNGTPSAFQTVAVFPPNTPAFERETGFVAKLSSDGLRWRFIGAICTSGGNLVNQLFSTQGDLSPVKVAVDTNGAIYVAGTASAARPLFTLDTVTVVTLGWAQVTQDTVQPVANGLGAADMSGAFVLKLAADGAYVEYAALLGSGIATGLALDAHGNAFVTGYEAVGKLVVNAGQATPSFNSGTGSPFVAKINDQLVPLVLVSDQNPGTAGRAINLVAKAGDRRYAGTVDFYDGAVRIGTAQVTAGAASISASLALGIHRLRAVYRGAGPFDGTSSSEVIQTINQASVQ